MEQQRVIDRFFVYIIESPSAPDLYHGRSEGARLVETLKLDGIACVSRTAINRTAFMAALRIGLPEEMKLFPDRIPLIHLSAHGSEEGIQLSSDEVMTWDELRDQLVPINQSLNGNLLLFMSACQGYSACQMAMRDGDGPHPFLGMVGSPHSPMWSDTAIAYLTLYHLLAKGKTIPEAVSAMKVVSGCAWFFESADTLRKCYVDIIANSAQPKAAQQRLEAIASEGGLPAEAKALERDVK